MVDKKPPLSMAQKSSNSRAEAMKAAMFGAKKVADTSNTNTKSKKGKNTMATKKASAKKMMAKPAAKPAAKDTGMTAAQKKLPAFIQKSIMAKNKAKKK
jgi:hypothetical protein